MAEKWFVVVALPSTLKLFWIVEDAVTYIPAPVVVGVIALVQISSQAALPPPPPVGQAFIQLAPAKQNSLASIDLAYGVDIGIDLGTQS